MPNLVKVDYNELAVSFTEDGWFNATKAAEKFGKRVDNWLRLDETKEYIAALERYRNPSEVRDSNTTKNGFLRTRRGQNGGTWLHPDLAVLFARWLDIDFAVWCDRQIKAIISGHHPHYDWKRLRHEATSSYKVMNAVLQLHRQMQGKPSVSHHFSNEARLINWALTGEFKGIDRESLEAGDLDMLAKLEERNTVLIGCGLEYPDRKKALEQFALDWRTLHVPAMVAA